MTISNTCFILLFETCVRRLWVIESNSESNNTRERLLVAAGEVFAEQGFRAATVREICGRAGVNIAAVNYHFGDKQQLYAAVLRHAHKLAVGMHPPDGGLSHDTPAEERLAAFIRSFIRRLTLQGRPAWHGKLMLREVSEPTEALDGLVEEAIRPQLELVRSLVRELLGPDAQQKDVELCAASVIGQCTHFQIAREVLTRLIPGLKYDSATIEALANHVVRFSLAAIRSLTSKRDASS